MVVVEATIGLTHMRFLLVGVELRFQYLAHSFVLLFLGQMLQRLVVSISQRHLSPVAQ